MKPFPNFRLKQTLIDHIQESLQFYHPRCIDESGGFYHYFKDDGQIYDQVNRHLVSSTRFIFVYAMAHRHLPHANYLNEIKHGLAFLRNVHRNPSTGGYAWQLEWNKGLLQVKDSDNHCYGLAFVLLAYAHALMAGLDEARSYLDETFTLMEEKFWNEEFGLYADVASSDWKELNLYRGQNANMHSCEAMLAAYLATQDVKYLFRAERLAKAITQQQAAQAHGLIWEHYDSEWKIDWNYNLDDKANLFRPWGFQPGHFTEWSKLLLQLEVELRALNIDAEWILPTAEGLFSTAMEYAWDEQHGGICYGFALDYTVCDGDKYFWVQAETLAAAARLAHRTGKPEYWEWYEKIWRYSWTHFIDHQHGAWYRILSRENQKLSDEKSPAGKTDYHTMGACYEVLPLLEGAQ